jgi:hypothetical protein
LSTAPQGPPEAGTFEPHTGGPVASSPAPLASLPEVAAAAPFTLESIAAEASATQEAQQETQLPLLGALPVGARLILRCRKDWRAATIAAFEPEQGRVILSVASPGGHTYRVRRPADSVLTPDGPLLILGGGVWRACFARYDLRW